jgi:signal transduction histidine kinase
MAQKNQTNRSRVRSTFKSVVWIVTLLFSFDALVVASPAVYTITVNEAYGKVTQRWRGKTAKHTPAAIKSEEKTIILLEDAHDNYGVQKNITDILLELVENARKKGLDPIVGLEGAIGKIEYDELRTLPLRTVRRSVSNDLMHEGYLTGAEVAAIAASHSFNMWGVESVGLFYENLELFQSLYSELETYKPFLDELNATLVNLKEKAFTNEQKEVSACLESFLMKESSFETFFEGMYAAAQTYAIPLDDFFQIQLFEELMICAQSPDTNVNHKEALLDAQKLTDELFLLATVVQRKIAISPVSLSLVDLSVELRRSLEVLNLKATRNEYEHVTPDSILKVINEVHKYAKEEGLLNSISLLTPEKQSQLEGYISRVCSFYDSAKKRDSAMIENLLARMNEHNNSLGILVVGGFHASGIRAVLEKRNISYVNIIPYIERTHDESGYLDRMFGRLLPLVPHAQSYINASLVAACGPRALEVIKQKFNGYWNEKIANAPDLASKLYLLEEVLPESEKQKTIYPLYLIAEQVMERARSRITNEDELLTLLAEEAHLPADIFEIQKVLGLHKEQASVYLYHNKKRVESVALHDITDEACHVWRNETYTMRVIRLLERAYKVHMLTKEEEKKIVTLLERSSRDDFKIFGANAFIETVTNYFFGEYDPAINQLIIARDFVDSLDARGFSLIADEYILHELLCRMYGHYQTVFLLQKIFPEHYRQAPFDTGFDKKYVSGERLNPYAPFEGLLGEKIKIFIEDGAMKRSLRIEDAWGCSSSVDGPDGRIGQVLFGDVFDGYATLRLNQSITQTQFLRLLREGLITVDVKVWDSFYPKVYYDEISVVGMGEPIYWNKSYEYPAPDQHAKSTIFTIKVPIQPVTYIGHEMVRADGSSEVRFSISFSTTPQAPESFVWSTKPIGVDEKGNLIYSDGKVLVQPLREDPEKLLEHKDLYIAHEGYISSQKVLRSLALLFRRVQIDVDSLDIGWKAIDEIAHHPNPDVRRRLAHDLRFFSSRQPAERELLAFLLKDLMDDIDPVKTEALATLAYCAQIEIRDGITHIFNTAITTIGTGAVRISKKGGVYSDLKKVDTICTQVHKILVSINPKEPFIAGAILLRYFTEMQTVINRVLAWEAKETLVKGATFEHDKILPVIKNEIDKRIPMLTLMQKLSEIDLLDVSTVSKEVFHERVVRAIEEARKHSTLRYDAKHIPDGESQWYTVIYENGIAEFYEGLIEIIGALAQNSFESGATETVIKIKKENDERIVIDIIDNGGGIKEKDMLFVMEPFFSTKMFFSSLSVYRTAKKITDIGGKFQITSEEKVGTTVHMEIPVTEKKLFMDDTRLDGDVSQRKDESDVSEYLHDLVGALMSVSLSLNRLIAKAGSTGYMSDEELDRYALRELAKITNTLALFVDKANKEQTARKDVEAGIALFHTEFYGAYIASIKKFEEYGLPEGIGPTCKQFLELLFDPVSSKRGTLRCVVDLFNEIMYWFGYSLADTNVREIIAQCERQYAGKVVFDVDCPAGIFDTYQHVISEAIVEIVKNAADPRKHAFRSAKWFGPDREVKRIDISVRPEAGELRVTIKDNGDGMTEEEKKRVFKMGATSASIEKGIEGTGKGMPGLKNKIEAVMGTIDFESTKGDGTTFTFSVPYLQRPSDVKRKYVENLFPERPFINVCGLRGALRKSMAIKWASLFGLRYINERFVVRALLYLLLHDINEQRVPSDTVNDPQKIADYIRKNAERIDYSQEPVRMQLNPAGPYIDATEYIDTKGRSLRKDIKIMFDGKSEGNESLWLYIVTKNPDVKRALNEFILAKIQEVEKADEYAGVALMSTEPYTGEGIITVMVTANPQTRMIRSHDESILVHDQISSMHSYGPEMYPHIPQIHEVKTDDLTKEERLFFKEAIAKVLGFAEGKETFTLERIEKEVAFLSPPARLVKPLFAENIARHRATDFFLSFIQKELHLSERVDLAQMIQHISWNMQNKIHLSMQAEPESDTEEMFLSLLTLVLSEVNEAYPSEEYKELRVLLQENTEGLVAALALLKSSMNQYEQGRIDEVMSVAFRDQETYLETYQEFVEEVLQRATTEFLQVTIYIDPELSKNNYTPAIEEVLHYFSQRGIRFRLENANPEYAQLIVTMRNSSLEIKYPEKTFLFSDDKNVFYQELPFFKEFMSIFFMQKTLNEDPFRYAGETFHYLLKTNGGHAINPVLINLWRETLAREAVKQLIQTAA